MSRRRGWAAPDWPTVPDRSSASAGLPEPAGQGPGGPAVHAGHRHRRDLARLDPGVLEGALPGVGPQLEVAGLAEPLLPQLGPRLARRPPAVGELVGGRGAPQVLGEQRRARPGVPHHHGGRRVPAGRLVTAGGQTVAAVRRHHQHRPGAGQRGDEGAHPRAQRPAEVEGGHVGSEPQRPVDGGGIGLVEVGGVGGGEPQGPRGLGRSRPQGQAGRLDPHGRGVLVVGGHGPRPAAAPRAEEGGDLRARQPPVGDVAGGRGDSTHGRKRSRRRAGSDWPSGADRGREACLPAGTHL